MEGDSDASGQPPSKNKKLSLSWSRQQSQAAQKQKQKQTSKAGSTSTPDDGQPLRFQTASGEPVTGQMLLDSFLKRFAAPGGGVDWDAADREASQYFNTTPSVQFLGPALMQSITADESGCKDQVAEDELWWHASSDPKYFWNLRKGTLHHVWVTPAPELEAKSMEVPSSVEMKGRYPPNMQRAPRKRATILRETARAAHEEHGVYDMSRMARDVRACGAPFDDEDLATPPKLHPMLRQEFDNARERMELHYMRAAALASELYYAAKESPASTLVVAREPQPTDPPLNHATACAVFQYLRRLPALHQKGLTADQKAGDTGEWYLRCYWSDTEPEYGEDVDSDDGFDLNPWEPTDSWGSTEDVHYFRLNMRRRESNSDGDKTGIGESHCDKVGVVKERNVTQGCEDEPIVIPSQSGSEGMGTQSSEPVPGGEYIPSQLDIDDRCTNSQQHSAPVESNPEHSPTAKCATAPQAGLTDFLSPSKNADSYGQWELQNTGTRSRMAYVVNDWGGGSVETSGSERVKPKPRKVTITWEYVKKEREFSDIDEFDSADYVPSQLDLEPSQSQPLGEDGEAEPEPSPCKTQGEPSQVQAEGDDGKVQPAPSEGDSEQATLLARRISERQRTVAILPSSQESITSSQEVDAFEGDKRLAALHRLGKGKSAKPQVRASESMSGNTKEHLSRYNRSKTQYGSAGGKPLSEQEEARLAGATAKRLGIDVLVLSQRSKRQICIPKPKAPKTVLKKPPRYVMQEAEVQSSDSDFEGGGSDGAQDSDEDEDGNLRDFVVGDGEESEGEEESDSSPVKRPRRKRRRRLRMVSQSSTENTPAKQDSRDPSPPPPPPASALLAA